MAIRCISIYVFAIQIVCVLINNDVFVRSVCFEDFWSFFNSSQACAFGKVDFDKIFNDNAKERCQVDCSLISTDPPFSNLNSLRVYKIATMELFFVSRSFKSRWKTLCRNYMHISTRSNIDIAVGCEGRFILNRGIGEKCVNNDQCTMTNNNSKCNETSGVCQCEAGYLYIWETNTCFPVKAETEKTEHSGLVIGVGVAGLVLGVAICGLLYFILTHYKKKFQIRCDKEIREETSVQVSCSLNPEQFDNRQGNDDGEALGVYNFLNEPVNISVQLDYDHVPHVHQGTDDDDYSHMNSCNANKVDSSGEYGVIS